ncbi:MAG TPA: T9SS type A sorting domain-containing protein [Bacteroidia bacterium]|jgi:hypothetical protein
MKKLYFTLFSLFTAVLLSAQCPVQTQQTNVTCFGQCNGTAMAFGSGNGPYQYSWLPGGQTTQSVSGLCAGTYSVYVLNASACLGQATVTITQPSQLQAAATGQNSNNCTNCNGMLIGTETGGTPSYTFSWMPTNCNQQTCTGICPGTYTFMVTDANGCTATSTWTISSFGGPTVSTSSSNASCQNCCNGTATANATGNAPFTYSWNNGQTTATATGLCPGSYTVCVTDNSGCTSCQNVTVNFSVGISESNSITEVSVSPVPATDQLLVSFSNKNENETQLLITDLLGNIVFNENEGNATSVTKQVDVSSFAKGMYFLQVITHDGKYVQRIVKE